MPSRLTLNLGAMVLSLLIVTGLSIRWALVEARTAEILRGEITDLQTEVRVLDERLRALPGELERQRELRKPVEKALNENPDWRDAVVPDAIADGLCARLRCAPVHPVPTPHR